jgi:hypothetical protein
VAAHDLPAETGRRLVVRGETEWLRSSAIYFRVPAGVGRLTVEATLERGAGVWLTLSDPGRRAPAGAQSGQADTLRVVVNRPAPGVWELALQNGRVQRDLDLQGRPPAAAKYTLAVSVAP